MKLSDEQIQEILEAAKPDILASVKADLTEEVTRAIRHSATVEVEAFAREWIKGNVIPEVEKALIESKGGLVSLGVVLAEETVQALALSTTEALKSKLEKNWERKKIMEALFG